MALKFVSSSSQSAEVGLDQAVFPQTTLTMNCWFNPSMNQSDGYLCQIYAFDVIWDVHLALHITGNFGTIPPSNVAVTASIKGRFTTVAVNTGAAWTTNAWQMATCTIGPSRKFKVYLNGGNEGFDPNVSSLTLPQQTLALGYEKGANANYFNGSLAEVAVYKFELREVDVQNLYDGKLRPIDFRSQGGLLHYSRLIDTSYTQTRKSTTGDYTTSASAPTAIAHPPINENLIRSIPRIPPASTGKIISIGGAVSKGSSAKLAG